MLERNNWYLSFSREIASANYLPDNKIALLPGLLPSVPIMSVLLTDSIACELGLSNGIQGIFRELVYDDQEDPGGLKVKSDVFLSNAIYIRKPLYALVEIKTYHKQKQVSMVFVTN